MTGDINHHRTSKWDKMGHGYTGKSLSYLIANWPWERHGINYTSVFSNLFHLFTSLIGSLHLVSRESYKTAVMIKQHWFRQWLGVVSQQAITWVTLDPDLRYRQTWLGHNDWLKWHDRILRNKNMNCRRITRYTAMRLIKISLSWPCLTQYLVNKLYVIETNASSCIESGIA